MEVASVEVACVALPTRERLLAYSVAIAAPELPHVLDAGGETQLALCINSECGSMG